MPPPNSMLARVVFLSGVAIGLAGELELKGPSVLKMNGAKFTTECIADSTPSVRHVDAVNGTVSTDSYDVQPNLHVFLRNVPSTCANSAPTQPCAVCTACKWTVAPLFYCVWQAEGHAELVAGPYWALAEAEKIDSANVVVGLRTELVCPLPGFHSNAPASQTLPLHLVIRHYAPHGTDSLDIPFDNPQAAFISYVKLEVPSAPPSVPPSAPPSAPPALPVNDGSSAELAATSCAEIHAGRPSLPDGNYWLTNSGGSPWQAWCWMTVIQPDGSTSNHGGGWTLVALRKNSGNADNWYSTVGTDLDDPDANVDALYRGDWAALGFTQAWLQMNCGASQGFCTANFYFADISTDQGRNDWETFFTKKFNGGQPTRLPCRFFGVAGDGTVPADGANYGQPDSGGTVDPDCSNGAGAVYGPIHDPPTSTGGGHCWWANEGGHTGGGNCKGSGEDERGRLWVK